MSQYSQKIAGQGIPQQWAMKREMLSPRYTTRYSDLLMVR
ncbi:MULTISPECIES: DUF4113 domain-containing protein [Salmonella]|nr:DUF4113 domain-containing protein [Salmonella enterica]